MNFTDGVRVVKGNPVIIGVYVGSKQPTFTEKVTDLITRNKCSGASSEIAASEVIKLLEAEDKTLTLLAADLDVPLWKAMKFADYGKKVAIAEVGKVGKELITEFYEPPSSKCFLLASGKIMGIKEFQRRLNK